MTDMDDVDEAFSGYGIALRGENDPPIPGEPLMSIADAKRIARELLAKQRSRPQPGATLQRDEPAAHQERLAGAPPARGERFAAFTGSSYNADTRTVEAVFATGVRVNRGWFSEELDMSPGAVDVSRGALNQLRFLFSHDPTDVLGVVRNANLQNGVLSGQLQFADTPRATEFAGMVQRGELTGVSVGYQVRTWKLVEVTSADQEVWRATDWELLEVSLVSVPADPNAGVRSMAVDPGSTPHEEDEMLTREQPGAAEPASQPAPAPAPAAERAAPAPAPAVVEPAPAPAERAAPAGLTVADALQLQAQARQLGVEDETREAFTRDGVTAAALSRAILEAAAARQASAAVVHPAGGAARVERDEGQTRNEAVETAILLAIGGRPRLRSERLGQLGDVDQARVDRAREYRGLMLSEMAALVTGDRSMPRTVADREAVFTRAFHVTSDFPTLLTNALNQRLLENYVVAPSSYRRFSQQMTFADFREHDLLRVGDFPQLQAVNEGGEVKAGTIKDAKKEKATVTAYGITFSLSRQLLVNDRLGGIEQALASQGTQVALFEEKTFYVLKAKNSGLGPTLNEVNRSMFHASNNNYDSSGSAITNTSLGAGRAKMRKQTNLQGDAMGLGPSILLVGPDKETEAAAILHALEYANQASNVNIFSGQLDLVVGGQIGTSNAWELYTDPMVGSNWAWGLLEGYEAPRLTVESVFGSQGVRVSLEHDFGVAGQDYRFGYHNAGA
jgi:HK97 family phage prohead protease